MTDQPEAPTPIVPTVLPPGISEDDEIQTTWEIVDGDIKIIASLGEASVTVEHSPAGATIIPWLIAAMPSVLDAVSSAMDSEEEE